MIFLNHTPFALNSSISVFSDNDELTLDVPSNLPTMAEFIVNLSNKYADKDVKIRLPSADMQQEFERLIRELEIKKYNENNIELEWL